MFLFISGLVLLAGERFRRARPQPQPQVRVPAEAAAMTRPAVPGAHARQAGGRQVTEIRAAADSDARIARLPFRDSFYVGVLQITALFAGIRRPWTFLGRHQPHLSVNQAASARPARPGRSSGGGA